MVALNVYEHEKVEGCSESDRHTEKSVGGPVKMPG